MKAFAIAAIATTKAYDEIAEYLQRIDNTLGPFGGRYLIHGGPYHVLEGPWTGDLVVIEFPSMEMARNWYESGKHQSIQPLRARNKLGSVFLVNGVPKEHKGSDILKPREIC